MNNTRVIGIDLSKSSTGISIIDTVDNGNLKVVDNYSIKPLKAADFTKLYFYVKNILMAELKELFKSQEVDFSVAFEFNIFSNYMSELHFYLTQELLNLCHRLNIDAVGYSPHFLKKFVKLFVTDGKKYPSYLDKPHIRDIYETYVYPLNKNVLPEFSKIKDSDSMDALFLGIMGSVLQAQYLKYSAYSHIYPMTLDNILQHKFDSFLLTQCNFYRDIYLQDISQFHFNNFRFNNLCMDFGEQFKELIKDSKNNKHLTLMSHMFFPFGILYLMTCKMRVFRSKYPEKFYEFWAKYVGSRVSYLKKKFPLDKEFVCLFNNKGDYFLYLVKE